MVKRFSLTLILFLGAGFLLETRTQGFRLAHFLTELPKDKRWQNSPLSSEVEARLHQPFTFLGKGGWCYAFLGEDQKTVVKFFRKDTAIELPFNSCSLLYKEAQEKTGLLYVHIQETKGCGALILYDPIGIIHSLELDKCAFVVQERADLIFSRLGSLMRQGDFAGAKKSIDTFLDCLSALHKQGLKDLDRSFTNNFGFVGEKAVALDVSSFVKDPLLQRPGAYKKETIRKVESLSRWLRKHYPELSEYCEERLDNFTSQ